MTHGRISLGKVGSYLLPGYIEWNSLLILTDTLSKDVPDWPKPSSKAEKMRYDTVSQCREALQQSSPTGTNRHRKECFEQWLNDAVEDISKTIARVTSIGISEQGYVKNLLESAANNWLEICSQRYRVVVILPNENGNILRSDWRRTGNTLDLIARPQLRRAGNAQGQELEREEIIGDWTGSENVWKHG